MAKQTSLEKKFEEFDKARAEAKEAESKKTELSDEIKALLEEKKIDEVDGVEFKCIYKFEKDKEVEEFDEEKFAEKEPKKHAAYIKLMKEMQTITKKYTKKRTVKGARKLIITRKNEGEE